MPEAPKGTDVQSPATGPHSRGRRALLGRHPWMTFLLPLFVYMLVGTLEPTPDAPGGVGVGLAIPYPYYPVVYTLKIILTVAAIIFVLPGYREFPFRIRPLAVSVGAVGIVVWVGLCRLDREYELLASLLESVRRDGVVALGTRSGFNPLDRLQENPTWAWGFLAVRFVGLVAVVPVIEEFFLRGFLMRFVVAADWRAVPIGKVNAIAVLIGTLLYPVLTHPAEALAAVAWFSMVTWLMVKTRNLWDCIVAHAVTNLLLGIYVVGWDQWHLM